ncbi:hypothetical protein LJC60_01110 [Ruminococcaceae bacterium OttesenSCG-928-D13]|nr:hypothetical protein [Ruminococcaceae bacterium OttesenSCG-928-D13]
MEVATNMEYLLEIDTTPAATDPTWEKMCVGFSNLSDSLNEVIQQFTWLCSQGWGSSEVTGGQYIVTLTGQRVRGDAAQDYIFSPAVRLNFGKARKTRLRFSHPQESTILWNVTIATITGGSGNGDANNLDAITVVLHGNGPPTIEDEP